MSRTMDAILGRSGDDNTGLSGAQPGQPVATTANNDDGKKTPPATGAVQPAGTAVAEEGERKNMVGAEAQKIADEFDASVRSSADVTGGGAYIPGVTVPRFDRLRPVESGEEDDDSGYTFTEDELGDKLDEIGVPEQSTSTGQSRITIDPSLYTDDEETKAWIAKQDAARSDIIKALEEEAKSIKPTESEDERKKREKREKRARIFAAIGDGISALSNLYFTTKGAPNMYTKNTLSDRTREGIERMKKEREADRDRWLKLQTSRYGMLDDVIKQRRETKKTYLTLMQQAQKMEQEARVAEARAKVYEEQGNHYAAQAEYEKARTATQGAMEAKYRADAKKAEEEAKWVGAEKSSVVNRNNAAAGASAASAENSRASASEHRAKAANERSGRGGSSKYYTEYDGIIFPTQADYERYVYGQAEEHGVSRYVNSPEKDPDTGVVKVKKTEKKIPVLANEVSRAKAGKKTGWFPVNPGRGRNPVSAPKGRLQGKNYRIK